MSWLARSVANSLMSDHGIDDEDEDDDDDDGEDGRAESKRSNHEDELGGCDVIVDEEEEEAADPCREGGGVKQDISQLTQTLTRQFWGVASFLAPPPPPPLPSHPISSSSHLHRRHSNRQEEAAVADSPTIAGIRSDFAEIGGSLRSGISRLSNNAAVAEIGKIASNFLPYKPEEEQEQEEEYEHHHHQKQQQQQQKYKEEEEEDEACVIGVTDEVMLFARNIAMHPETWLDFPLFNDFEDTNGRLFSSSFYTFITLITAIIGHI